MKRLFCAMVIALSLLSVSASAAKTFRIFLRAECADLNKVGHEWSIFFNVEKPLSLPEQSFRIDGNLLSVEAGSIDLKVGDIVSLRTKMEEQDKYPDIGCGSVQSHALTKSDIENGFTLSQQITVRENGGRYTGNTCDWKVTYEFR